MPVIHALKREELESGKRKDARESHLVSLVIGVFTEHMTVASVANAIACSEPKAE